MFGLLRMVAWTMTAIAMLLLFTSPSAQAQDVDGNATSDQVSERVIADRYERILSNRPQLGSAFDKFYEIHVKQGTLVELCKRLEQKAKSSQGGKEFLLLGLLQMRQGLAEDSVASLTQAESLLPSDPLSSLYLSQARRLNRQYTPALEALINATTRKPIQSVAIEIVKELRLLKDRGLDVDLAAKLLNDLEQQFKTNPQVNEVLAESYIELGRPAAALPIYENLIALTRDPLRRMEVRMQLARLKKRLGEPQQALNELEQLATQVKPQSWLHASLLEQIEQLTQELHGVEGLVAYYERTLLNRPDDVSSMLRLAKILSTQSRIDDAQKWIAKAIEASPTQPEPLLAKVDLLEESKQFKLASESMQQLVQLEPANVDYIVRWGRLEAQSGSTSSPQSPEQTVHFANATSIWKRILIAHERDPGKAIQVAELLRSISLSEEALELYRQAVQVSGGKVEFSEMLAEYLVELARVEEARSVLSNAMAAVSEDRESLFQLSKALSRFNFKDDAIEALQKACASRPAFADLLQLADLQRSSERHEVAIKTLNRAANIAESAEDLTKAWDAQAKTYKLSWQLA